MCLVMGEYKYPFSDRTVSSQTKPSPGHCVCPSHHGDCRLVPVAMVSISVLSAFAFIPAMALHLGNTCRERKWEYALDTDVGHLSSKRTSVKEEVNLEPNHSAYSESSGAHTETSRSGTRCVFRPHMLERGSWNGRPRESRWRGTNCPLSRTLTRRVSSVQGLRPQGI